MQHGYEVFHSDIRVPARFYVEVLGFTCDGEANDPASGYITVTRGSLTVGCSRFPILTLARASHRTVAKSCCASTTWTVSTPE